jgi:hypothetical protein
MNDTNKDLEHLKILSICYYISAGITALFSCIPFIHLFIGLAIVTNGFPDDGNNAPPPFFGWMFVGMASIFILGGWAIAFGTYLAGKYIKQRKNYIFCLIMAGVNCMFFPFGVALGIFTFLVLMRESVKVLFNGASAQGFAPSTSNPPDWR